VIPSLDFFGEVLALSILINPFSLLMESLTQFFWFCSGANFSLLKRVPTESSKYFGIGATVFFTGLLAFFSSGYALYTVFQSIWPAIVFGVIWGIMIFNLDRFIVSSMRKKQNSWAEWKLAIPRLALAVLLAIVISKPLELKMFEREINRKIDEKKTEFISQSKVNLAKGFPEIQELERKIDTLKSEIKISESFRDQVQNEYDAERFGEKTSGTSGIVGLGTNAKKKEQQLDAAQLALEDLKKRNQVRIDSLEAQVRTFVGLRQLEFEKQQPGIESFDGLAARMDALSKLTDESSAMSLANIFIMLLFVAIETSPIFVKLIAPRGPYDELLELHEEKVRLATHEKSVISKGESDARIDYFQSTHFYNTDLKKEKTNKKNKAQTLAEIADIEEKWSRKI
jgi:MFS superfamily sulfate permease-like transporter